MPRGLNRIQNRTFNECYQFNVGSARQHYFVGTCYRSLQEGVRKELREHQSE